MTDEFKDLWVFGEVRYVETEVRFDEPINKETATLKYCSHDYDPMNSNTMINYSISLDEVY